MKNEVLVKIPPHDTDLEMAVLGTLMFSKDAIVMVADILKPEVFYDIKHEKIYKAIQVIFRRSSPIDPLTVTAQLRQNGDLEAIGGMFYLTELTDRMTTAGSIEEHASLLYQMFLQRELISAGNQLVESGFDKTIDVFDLVDTHQAKIFSIIQDVSGKSFTKIGDAVQDRFNLYAQKPEDGLTGIGTSLSIDRTTNGFQPSDLIIIAARPAMGKSVFALSCARNAAIDFNKPGAVFSLEMSTEQLTDRLIASETEVYLDKLNKRDLNETDWRYLNSRINKLLEAGIYIDDTAGLSVMQFRAKARRMKELHDIQWIVIDYLQLMHADKGKGGNREQEISQISRELKKVAKELNIPVIALSQLSRAVETRPGGNKRPMLSDLRESGSIEQDADVVMFLYRPEYYGLVEDEQGRSTAGICEIIIAKNRHGVCDTIPLRFNGALMKFYNLESEFGTRDFKEPGAAHSDTFTMPRSEFFDSEEPAF